LGIIRRKSQVRDFNPGIIPVAASPLTTLEHKLLQSFGSQQGLAVVDIASTSLATDLFKACVFSSLPWWLTKETKLQKIS
jgi:hypothetical protein